MVKIPFDNGGKCVKIPPTMKLSDFDYHLPEELIAQYPAQKRDGAKMMVVYRNTGEILHRHFKDLPDFLDEKYLIVYNDSKVVPCRAFGYKNETGGKFEVFFLSPSRITRTKNGSALVGPFKSCLKETGDNIWECMVKPKKRARIGTKIIFRENSMEGEVTGFTDDGMVNIKFPGNKKIENFLKKFGHMPLPPYIKRDYAAKNDEGFDRKRYQSIFADKNGSIAAPTASLHFSKTILNKLKKKHVGFTSVTLHVGLGTFLPLREEEIENTKLHYEYYSLGKNTADKINQAKKQGVKVLAVGTTSTRVLESAGAENGIIKPNEGNTSLFIYPGKKFNVVDTLLTNFHLPKSSLFILVSAFAEAAADKCALSGTELIKNAYSEAVKNKYKFFSYGDCMLILDK
ncbi:MAG: tRNA preQ1(34) S-adenosylmethionine ribosyltransferase-isomerase QueA [bacterium]|nr:tRNA preQ1(34) S-adenosylmethionine ribosyltransferase-isomerase QueA [bacterium]